MILLGLLIFSILGVAPSWGAVAFVKASTQGSCGAASSCGSSFGSLPSSGNAVIVTTSCWNASVDCNVSSVTDNQGNTYTQAVCLQQDTGVANNQACIYYAIPIGTPSGTFTVTANASASTYFEVIAVEYSGVSTTSPVDVTKSAKNTTGTSDTGASSSTTQANELAVCVSSVSANNSSLSYTTPTGYTRRGIQNNATTTIGFESSDKILSATDAQQCAWTHSTTSMDGWAAVLATFKASSSRRSMTPLFFP